MTKKTKLLFIFLILVTIVLLVYLTTSTKTVTIVPDNTVEKNKSDFLSAEKRAVDPEKLEAGYKIQLNNNLKSYNSLVDNFDQADSARSDTALEAIVELKKKLTTLNVPEKYKDLHLGVVLAISDFELFIKDGDEEKNKKSSKSMEEFRNSYAWLN